MTKRKGILIIIISIISIISIIIVRETVIHTIIHKKYVVKEGSIEKYSRSTLYDYTPDEGYVPNAETAISIAKAVSAATFPELKKGGGYEVEYDKKNEVWIVNNYKLFRSPIYVIISKRDGRILRIWAYK